MFNIISAEQNVIGNICEILDNYIEFTIQQKKLEENETNLQFEDYRVIDRDEKTNYVNDKFIN